MSREPEFNLIARPVRFDQIDQVTHVREHQIMDPGGFGKPTMVIVAGLAEIHATRDGKKTFIKLEGFRHQERLVDAINATVAGLMADRAEEAFGRAGFVSFGSVAISRDGLTAPDGAGSVFVPWTEIVSVELGGGGAVVVRRKAKPGERSAMRDGSVFWPLPVIPNAEAAAALINAIRAGEVEVDVD